MEKPMSKRPTTSASNLVLEHLRHIRAAVDAIRDDIRDLKTRVTSMEISVATLLGADAAKSDRIDRLEDRIDRLERRLEISQ